MPKKSEAQKAALAAGRQVLAQKREAEHDAQAKYGLALEKAKNQLDITRAELQDTKKKAAGLYKTLRAERRKALRATHIKMLNDAELEATQGDADKAIQLLNMSQAENQELKLGLDKLLEKCAMNAQEAENHTKGNC